MDRTSRYARCEAPTRSCTLSTTAANGHSQRNKETGEPDDATSILSGSAGGWEKRPKGPRSQPTQLQSSRSTLSRGSFLSFLAFKEGMLSTPISVLGGWPTVSGGFLRLISTVAMRSLCEVASQKGRIVPISQGCGKWSTATPLPVCGDSQKYPNADKSTQRLLACPRAHGGRRSTIVQLEGM